MAKHLVSKQMEFFYSENFSLDLLFKELEKKFSYQSIVFVGKNKKIEKYVENNKKITLKCIFFDNFLEIKLENDIACIVCCGEENLNECKKICQKNTINLILYSAEYVSLSNFFMDGDEINLLGVVLDAECIRYNLNKFALNMLFDIAQLHFYILENKLNNIYFNESVSEKNQILNEKITKIMQIFKQKAKFLDCNEIFDFYCELITLLINQKNCIIFNSCLNNYNGYSKFIFVQILIKLYEIFNENISPMLRNYPSTDNLTLQNQKQVFELIKSIDDEKFWFIHSRFKLSVQSLIQNLFTQCKEITEICNLIDINQMYLYSHNFNLTAIFDYLKNMALSFKGNSFLKIIYSFGCLENDKTYKNRQV